MLTMLFFVLHLEIIDGNTLEIPSEVAELCDNIANSICDGVLPV
jgi:hypothetical protein